METVKKVNVAPNSTSGHYVEGARKVVSLHDVEENFLVEGKSTLTTKNHTNLNIDSDCLITSQVVYNPFSKMYTRVED